MIENLNVALIAITGFLVVISIFLKLRYSLLTFAILHIVFFAVMLGGGQAGGWFILIYVMHFLKPALIVLFVIIAIQVIKVSYLDSREPEKSHNEKAK